MIKTRHLQLISAKERKEPVMKVAFASTDKVHIDEHFGKAREFFLWDVSADNAEFTGVLQIDEGTGDADDRIEARSAALADCALVYVGQIGGPAAARLVAKKVHPLKSKTAEPISEVVEKLQQVLQGNPPPWLKKAMLK